jgi:hypothetical protein
MQLISSPPLPYQDGHSILEAPSGGPRLVVGSHRLRQQGLLLTLMYLFRITFPSYQDGHSILEAPSGGPKVSCG